MALRLGSYGGRGEVLVIRMGGGTRTYPGGVTKWQWKRLQEHKQRMREKAWLLRERRLYDKRRRQEMLASMPQLEKPWEQLPFPARTPTADAQLSALADRFRKRGALDLWNFRDGPSRDPSEDELNFDLFAEETEDSHVSAHGFREREQKPSRQLRRIDRKDRDERSMQWRPSRDLDERMMQWGPSRYETRNKSTHQEDLEI